MTVNRVLAIALSVGVGAFEMSARAALVPAQPHIHQGEFPTEVLVSTSYSYSSAGNGAGTLWQDFVTFKHGR